MHTPCPSAPRFPLAALLLVLTPVAAGAQGSGTDIRTARENGGLSVSERLSGEGRAGPARIWEESRILDTYPFSEPNPVPILVRDPRLYPYHSFEGYTGAPEPLSWKVVTLENDYIQVFVLPEVGGKVWGAVVKENGHEFIYRNEVVKFRNIALRGPWTSGGIEFNFGIIGHTPSTATPVDYSLVENPDGSVSCWVGSMDLPSRTHWRVEIRLPADRATFETNVLWYNPTPLEQPYYNWMTAAAFARNDLEMSMPGNAYLQHSGKVEAWPVDPEGRYLPLYANNTFGGSKSYHVVGDLHDFFGGYYHNDGYGFGHWARYEDMPGQKLWLWALSREGGVWEDLLTDTDGQYIEFQAGRLFVQYSPGADVNPITQAGFDPYASSRWSETWFPVEGIGGLTEASREGALYASEANGTLTIGVNAFRDLPDTLRVWSGTDLVMDTALVLETLKPFRTEVPANPGQSFRVWLPGLGLDYSSDPSSRRLARSFQTDSDAWTAVPEADRAVFQAREALKARRITPARELFQTALSEEPWNREALLGLGDISYRRGLFAEGLGYVSQALQLDAYDPEANFLAGLLYRALCRPGDARDAFGWAARSTAFKSAAYVQLAEMKIIDANALGWWGLAVRARAAGVEVDPEEFRTGRPLAVLHPEGAWPEAGRYARMALEANGQNLRAWQLLAIIGRRTGDTGLIQEARGQLLALDPLHHFLAAEAYLPAGGEEAAKAALRSFGGEYPDQTVMELAIGYSNLGMTADALSLFELGARGGLGVGPVQQAWMAMLDDGPDRLQNPAPPDFSFPYRVESLSALKWASEHSEDWSWDYLLGLDLWAVDRKREAASLFGDLGETPDFAPFYVARGTLLKDLRAVDPEPDLRRAVALDPGNRILHVQLIRHLQEAGDWKEALSALATAKERFPEDFNLDLLEALTLLNLHRGPEAAELLDEAEVLPSENARESHRLWEQAHIMWALDALEAGDFEVAREHAGRAMDWPEHLGQGRPYEPDERLPRFVLGLALLRSGDPSASDVPIRSLRSELDARAESLGNGLERVLIRRALTFGGGER